MRLVIGFLRSRKENRRLGAGHRRRVDPLRVARRAQVLVLAAAAGPGQTYGQPVDAQLDVPAKQDPVGSDFPFGCVGSFTLAPGLD